MSARDSRDLRELAQDLRADLDARTFGVRGLLDATHQLPGDPGISQVESQTSRRLDRLQWRDADDDVAATWQVLGHEATHVAAQQRHVHAQLRLHPLRAGVELDEQGFRLPTRRRLEHRGGCAQEEVRRHSRARTRPAPPHRGCVVPCRYQLLGTDIEYGMLARDAPGTQRHVTGQEQRRIPPAAAPSNSPCSATRLRSRQFRCRTGSMPACRRMRRRKQRRTERPQTRVLGDLYGIDVIVELPRARQQQHRVWNRSELGRDRERRRAHARPAARSSRSQTRVRPADGLGWKAAEDHLMLLTKTHWPSPATWRWRPAIAVDRISDGLSVAQNAPERQEPPAWASSIPRSCSPISP